ncbi:MAG: tetratricopeptide repeat protein [Prevotellaceae bacterium]|nr:tetratricopeptide repeat protein [Prevotellaceae bacterium]
MTRHSLHIPFIFTLLAAFCNHAQAQNTARDHVRLGNRQQRTENYQRAETHYQRAIQRDSTLLEAYYNIANTQILQSHDSAAIANYRHAAQLPTGNHRKRQAIHHNLGNAYYAQGISAMNAQNGNDAQFFQQAVDTYKEALRQNPDDNETRYNLAKAQYMLKKSQQNQQQNQQNKQNKQQQNDQQQQKQDQPKPEDKQDQKDKQQQQQPQQPEQKKDQMDDNTAEQLLNSAQQDEKQVQRKLQQQQGGTRRLEKDW